MQRNVGGGMMIWTGLSQYRDIGLLILRVGLGLALVAHGWPKLEGGPERWTRLGQAVVVGAYFVPAAWGFVAAMVELLGGLLLAVGAFFRPVAILLTIQMGFALFSHLHRGDGFNAYSHALELGIVFLGLILIGPGRYSVDRK